MLNWLLVVETNGEIHNKMQCLNSLEIPDFSGTVLE